MATLFENATLLDVEAGDLRPGAPVLVDGDPLRDITLLDGQGEHLLVVMRGGEIFHRA